MENLLYFTSTLICAGGSVHLVAGGATSYTWSVGGNTSSITLTADANTVITVTGGHSSNTCEATTAFSVNVVVPFLSVSASTAICQGAQASMSVQTASNINWVPQGGISQFPLVNPTVTTVFTVTAKVNTVSLSCPASNTVLVTVHPNPAVIATAQRAVMCRKEVNELSVTGASTYSWTTLGAGSQITYSASQAGSFTLSVTGTDNNGCVGTSSVKIQVNTCNGLGELATRRIKVYPVPSNGLLVIESEIDCELILVNSIGQTIRTVNLNIDNSRKALLKDLDSGVYFLSFTSGELCRKVVVE